MDTTKQPVCFIIITTYNGAKWIEKCIASCKASNYPVQVIVVDNDSADNTLELLPDDIHVLKLSKNVGFGRANNIGMMEAIERFDSEYVFLLNQDAYIKEDAVTELVKCHQENPEIGLLSPIHYGNDWTNYDYRFKIYMGRSKSHKIQAHKEKGIYHSNFVNAAAWFIPKETILKIGGFDPIFFHQGEDDNFCQRLRYHDLPIFITEKAGIQHDRQDRKKAKKKSPHITPPHHKVANRSKIVIYNPDMNAFVKSMHLVPLVLMYLVNLLLPTHRSKEKLSKDSQEFKEILAYRKKAKKLYNTEGIFLDQDYPIIFLKK